MRRRPALLAASLLCGATIPTHPATAQSRPKGDDLRDVVVTTANKEIRGRVAQRFGDEVLLMQGGKRVRIPRAKVRSMTTVTDHLRAFFEHRTAARDVPAREWMLVEWARSKGLHAMARLQALHVVLLEPGHDKAHEFLGHRKRRGSWLWKARDSWKTFRSHEREISDWGRAAVHDSEHFRLRSSASTRNAIDALFDLERLYVYWFDELGPRLHPKEVLADPMEVHAYGNRDDFPPFTILRYPYYFPQPNGDVSYTYFNPAEDTPYLLIQVAVEQLIYNTLADGMGIAPVSAKNRTAAWIEVGLGQWIQSLFVGDPGYAEPADPRLDRKHGTAVLARREYGLENLLGIRYSRFHDPHSHTPLHWANAATFVAFLMDGGSNSRRDHLMRYMQLAYRQGKGNSSSLFDKVFGTRIEKLEKEWMAWLERKIGLRATRVTRR